MKTRSGGGKLRDYNAGAKKHCLSTIRISVSDIPPWTNFD